MGKARKKGYHAILGDSCSSVLWNVQGRHTSASRANGFSGGGQNKTWASHHIVCLASMGTYKDQNNTVLNDTICAMEWNINDAPNMIGLPKKKQYKKEYSKGNFHPSGLPCHDVGHGSYLEEVSSYLEENVWSNFKSEPDKKKHEKDVEALKSQLETISEHFEAVLRYRGSVRNGGTVHSWKTRFDDNSDGDKRLAAFGGLKTKPDLGPLTKTNKWYEPFSMASVPWPRSPGINFDSLKNLFSKKFWK